MWQNKYIGIPYKDYGRDTSGIDCWGLACLVYREEFGIELPSFSEPGTYNAENRGEIAEIIAQNIEGWAEVPVPEIGDLVLFRIMGQPSHVGIAVSTTHFIHAMEGHACAIESFESINWKHRRVGFYKYTPQANVNNLVAVPHPLRTQKVFMNVAYGTTIQQVYDTVNQQNNISDRLKKHITILKNSMVVPQSEWSTTVVHHGDTLEYRAVPKGDGIGRLILTLAVVFIAVQTGMYFGGTEATIFGTGVATATAGQAAIIQAGVMMAGSMLVNAIMPIRPPAAPEDPGSAKAQLMYSGAANRTNPYGAIPFVLGKMRVTPPLGAENFVRFGGLTTGFEPVQNAEASYLDMLLVWGYGPLNIDETTMRIGDISIYDYSTTPPTPNFTNLKYITLDRKSTESANKQIEFDTIYGKDVDPVNSGVPLTCTGLPPVANGVWTPTITPGPWIVAGFSSPCDKVLVALHFPQGLRAIKTQGEGAGGSLAAPVSVTLEYRTTSTPGWNYWTTQTIGGSLTLNSVQNYPASIQMPGGEFGGSIEVPAYSVPISDNVITDGAPVKDAFTWTIAKDRISNGVAAWQPGEVLQVRVRRNTGDETEPSDSYRYSHAVIFQSATAISNSAPAVDPKYCKIAKTALSIQATDQLNGQIDGISAVVQTWCLDWNGTAWVEAATSNPASLFRYVLQSAANPQRVLDADVAAKIDLAQLQYWHNFCNQTRTDPQTGETYKFEFNDIIAAQRSVLDILRDICAAGKASPALIDGRWTVVIDEPRTQIIQHFSPHNSWGFEGTKMLPKFPDALKVQYYDQDFDYQQRELIIPFAGKTLANSELFETIQLPGITKKALAKDHARWHMAQAKLRPEVYTLNSDMEYLVCNRGDRVKVTHDVPMWGVGSGRIKDVYNNLVTYSEELNTNWTNATGATWQYSSALSPENTLTALGVDGLNGTGISATGTTLYQVVSGLTIGKTYTFSVYVRTKTGTHPGIRLRLNQTSNSVISTAVPVDETWQRVTVTATATTTTSFTCVVGTFGIGNFYIWGAMLNEGSVAQPYVKSTAVKGCSFALDEQMPMETNSSYTVRVRSNTGASVTRTVIAKPQDGYYSIIDVTTPVTTAEVGAGDLFLFGELNQESQDLIVLNIEPGANKTARLTLVDYGVTDTYNIFTDYLSLSNTTIFESQVTLPPGLLIAGFGTKKPTITGMVSDETVMELVAPGVFAYKLQVSFTNAEELPTSISHIEAQINYNNATDSLGIRTSNVDYTKGSVIFGDVDEGSEYKVRLRYVGSDGRYGTWTAWSVHTIVGKTNPPSPVTGFSYTVNANSGRLVLDWNNNPEIDVVGYEVRYSDSGWGLDNLYVYNGSNSQVEVDPRVIYAYTTWFIRAYDANNNYSSASSSINFSANAPIKINETLIEYSFADTSLTSATVTISWTQATTTNFSLSGYKVSYDDKEIFVNATSIILPADWVGIRNVAIKSVDIAGLESAVATVPIPKFAPNPINIDSLKLQVIDNTVLVTWELPAKTTLPISHVLLRKTKKTAGDNTYTWSNAENIGEKSGTFTSFSELSKGEYIYWIRTVDTDGVESTEIFKTVQVAQPPDYIFNAQFESTLSGTKTNAVINSVNNSIALPVNITETWEQHFEGPDISSYPLWLFDSTVEAWSASGATNTWNSGAINHNSTSLDPSFLSPTGLIIGGGQFRKVQVMIKRLSGNGWDGSLFYGNQFHGYRELGKGTLSVSMPIGEYKLLEWDMASMPNQDWTTSTISSFRIDFGSNASDSFRIEYVRIIPAAGISAVKGYSWLTPQSQITAGYPYYLQPGTTTGSYTEIFDYQTLLASSQVSVEATVTTIAGSGNIKYYLSYSANGTTYTQRQLTTSLFATNFRYIKVEVEVEENSANTLIEIKALTVLLDSKKISDSGKVTTLPADTEGTIVNLSKEFVDIGPITLSANANVPVVCTYNCKDFIQTATYNITSNVCTITTTTEHGLIAGQNIRATFIDGTGVNGVYTLISVPSTTTMTFSTTASDISSGGVYVYPNSFTVYVFDSDGVRMTTPVSVSWQVQGF